MRSSASRRARRLASEARLARGQVDELELVGRLAAIVRGPDDAAADVAADAAASAATSASETV